MSFPYIVQGNNITVVIDGKPHTVASSHPTFARLKEAVKVNDWDCYGDDFELPNLLTTRQQFCDLARCLGIPRKQPKPEPEGCTCLSSPNMLYAPCSYCDKQRKDGVK